MNAFAESPSKSETRSTWLSSLRIYFCIIVIGNLIWEFLHLPLYTIWEAEPVTFQAFAAVHCTLGDLLIAASTLLGALILVGDGAWPPRRFWPVLGVTIISGVGYTLYSEWYNVVVRGTWAYSNLMPVISLFGLNIGVAPLLQWITVPAIAFTFVRKRATHHVKGGSS